MKVSIIAIGDELLIGQVVDTNSGTIAKEINPDGWTVGSIRVVADNADDIRYAIGQAFKETDVVLTTGGLGTTKDDITKQTLCDLFGGTMVYDKEVEKNVLEVVGKRGLAINPLTAAQAYVPSSCKVIQNRVGTAPLMWFEKEGKVLVSMPGVPFEMAEMFHSEVFPMLKRHFPSKETVAHRTFIVIDYSESQLAAALDDFEEHELPGYIHLAYLPKPGVVRLRLTGHSHSKASLEAELDRLSDCLDRILGKSIICKDDKTPAEILGNRLIEKSISVATAESCTGGNIAHEITRIPGSSAYFKGAVIAYANEIKTGMLGVCADDIETEGAVSETVVRQMAENAAEKLHADCAIATSGIAGPGGGSPEKPVGTVWIAASCRKQTVARKFKFAGNRDRVINHASTMALISLIKLLDSQTSSVEKSKEC